MTDFTKYYCPTADSLEASSAGYDCCNRPGLHIALDIVAAEAHYRGVMEERARQAEAYRDLKHQFGDVVDTMSALQAKGSNLRAGLAILVGRGEGVTQDRLLRIFDEVDRLFPLGRKRNVTPESPIDPGVAIG